MKILVREHQGKGKPDLWKLHDGMKAILASMGEMGEATKEDANFLQDEEDIPAGTDSLDVGPSEDEMDEYKTMCPSVPGKLGLL